MNVSFSSSILSGYFSSVSAFTVKPIISLPVLFSRSSTNTSEPVAFLPMSLYSSFSVVGSVVASAVVATVVASGIFADCVTLPQPTRASAEISVSAAIVFLIKLSPFILSHLFSLLAIQYFRMLSGNRFRLSLM